MLQKWNIYVTYWNRVLREIENGTYVRHLAKVKRKADAEGRDLPTEMAFKRVRPPTSEVEMPRGLDAETGTGMGAASPDTSDEAPEQIGDRLTGLDPRRLPPPTPPPGALAALLAGAPPVPLSLDSPTPVAMPAITNLPPRITQPPPTTPGQKPAGAAPL